MKYNKYKLHDLENDGIIEAIILQERPKIVRWY